MGHKKKRKKKHEETATPVSRPLQDFVREKQPVIRFLGAFGAGVALFYIFYNSGFYTKSLEGAVLSTQAEWSGKVLRLLGYSTEIFEDVISTDKFRISIRGGCDGLESTALFLLAILVFPLPFRFKWKGILAGLLVLGILNTVRISGLFLIGTHANHLFDFFHLHAGVVLFTVASIVLWLTWVNWSFNQLEATKTTK